jgi:hypothetical protein
MPIAKVSMVPVTISTDVNTVDRLLGVAFEDSGG